MNNLVYYQVQQEQEVASGKVEIDNLQEMVCTLYWKRLLGIRCYKMGNYSLPHQMHFDMISLLCNKYFMNDMSAFKAYSCNTIIYKVSNQLKITLATQMNVDALSQLSKVAENNEFSCLHLIG